MASLRAPEAISSSQKSLLCLQITEGKFFISAGEWFQNLGILIIKGFWISAFTVLGIQTGATKRQGGLQPFICPRQESLPRPLLHPYLASLCRAVRANNSNGHFLIPGQSCWYPQSDRAKMRWSWVTSAYETPAESPLQLFDFDTEGPLYLGPGLKEGFSVMRTIPIPDLPCRHFCVLGPDLSPGKGRGQCQPPRWFP